MKIKQTNEAGEEVEIDVMTEDEVASKLEEVNKEWETKLEEKDSSLSSLASEKEDLEKKIDELNPGEKKEDNPNFKILKEALNKKDEDIKSLREEIESDRTQRTKESYDDKIKMLSKGDTALEEKIRLHLTTTLVGMGEKTEEDRTNKIKAAYKLSADDSSMEPGIFDGGIQGGSRGGGSINDPSGSGANFSSNERVLGSKLGITEEDYKKYGSRVSKRSQ